MKSMREQGKDISGLEVNAAETPMANVSGMSKDQLDIAKLKFEMSDATSQKITDSIYFIRNDSGSISTINISNPINKPILTNQVEVDKKLNSQYNSKIESRITDLVKLVENNQLDSVKAEQMIKELRNKKTTTKKISTKKPKAIKIKSIKIPKVKKIKVKAIKIPKIKTVKLKKIKPQKIARLKTTKIKV